MITRSRHSRSIRYVLHVLMLGLWLLSGSAVAQEGQQNLEFGGTLRDENKGRDGFQIQIFRDGALIEETPADRTGRFKVYLDYGFEYQLKFSKAGFYSKILQVNTKNVPVENQEFGHTNTGFQVSLIRETEGLDASLFERPIGIFFYDSQVDQFVFDRDYTEKIQGEIAKLQRELRERREAEERAKEQLEEDYKLALADAKLAIEDGNYDLAKDNLLAASNMKPDEKFPKQELTKVEKLMVNAEELEAKYAALIQEGDAAKQDKKYTEAKAKFEEAQRLKEKEAYPKKQLKEIAGLIAAQAKLEAEQRKKDQEYQSVIAEADRFYDGKDWNGAKKSYQKAQALKPDESHPKDRIAAIDKVLADEQQELAAAKAKQEQYDQLIATADKALNQKNYEEAKASYQKALGVLESEDYPKKKIEEIDRELEQIAAKNAAEKELNDQYNGVLAQADDAFKAEKWEDARRYYQDASKIKPAEQYPKDQVTEIGKKLDALAQAEKNARELQQQYDDLIASADKALGAKEYTKAKTDYEKAQSVKPDETYPGQQLTKLEGLMAEEERLAAEAEKKGKYDDLIASADKALKANNFAGARDGYTGASKLFPAEQYPITQLKEIDRLEAEAKQLAANQALKDQYDELVATADKAFKSKDWAAARKGYTDALAVLPAESYPQDQLKEIDRVQAEAQQQATQEKYDQLIAAADKALKDQDFAAARLGYQDASGVLPNEAYPKDQLKEVDRLEGEAQKLAADQAQKDQYDQLVATADKAFKGKDWDAARQGYQDALAILPAETYPQDQLKEVDRLVKEAEELAKAKDMRSRYDAFVTSGDKAFDLKNYPAARASYKNALGLLPDEQYPKDQLTEIRRLEEEAAALAAAQSKKDQEFDRLVAEGDEADGLGEFEVAKKAYRDALVIKPDAQYPADRLKDIEARLASKRKAAEDARLREEQYKQLIADGDAAVSAQNYRGAQKAFQDAVGLKADAEYPKEQLKLIEAELAKLAEAEAAQRAEEQKFADLIREGDQKYDAASYDAALTDYQAALEIKPGDSHAKDRIAAINRQLAQLAEREAEQAERNKRFTELVEKGDKLMGSESWQDAVMAYRSALELKPEEQYPKDKMAEAEGKLADLAEAAAREQAQNEQYDQQVLAGNQAFREEDYTAARTAYEAALAIKPDGSLPAEKLREIEQILADRAAKAAEEKARQDQYDQAVAAGDDAFQLEDWAAARKAFEAALSIKSNESYPKEQLKRIDLREKQAKEDEARKKILEARYRKAVEAGDKAMADKQFTSARGHYEEALAALPNEEHPQTQIKKIDDYLALKAKEEEEKRKAREQERLQAEKYSKLIAEGDKQFRSGEMEAAKTSYEEALAIKEDPYPKDKIKRIDEILAQRGVTVDTATDENKPEDSIEETVVEEKTKTITTRVVIRDGKRFEYKKIQHNWGGKFFFKDGESITELIWNRDTGGR